MWCWPHRRGWHPGLTETGAEVTVCTKENMWLSPRGQVQGFSTKPCPWDPRIPIPKRASEESAGVGSQAPWPPLPTHPKSGPPSPAHLPPLPWRRPGADIITAPPAPSQERGAEYSVSGETIKVPGRTWLRQLPLHKCIYYSSVALNI